VFTSLLVDHKQFIMACSLNYMAVLAIIAGVTT